jgi:hypothetical protein
MMANFFIQIFYNNLQLMHLALNNSLNRLGYSATHHLFEIDSSFILI